MFLCRRFPIFRAAFLHRNQVTISWPIKKGHDYLAWNRMQNSLLLEVKEQLESYQSTKSYGIDYNTKIRSTKENIAKLMGIDPDHFTDTHLKLSLLYLLPSDIQRKDYQPKIPKELPVSSLLEVIAQNSSSKPKHTALQSLNFKRLHKEIRLVHSVLLDAVEQISEPPGLELFIDPDEVLTLNEPEILSDDTADHEAADVSSDVPIDKLTDNPDFSINEMTDNVQELVDDVTELDISDNSESAGSVVNEDVNIESSPALLAFPFLPVCKGSDVEKEILQLQFNKLNHLIQDRPDLIISYYPTIKHILESTRASQSKKAAQNNDSSVTVFQGKVNKAFLFHSVVTTVVPGSGQITINDQSYLDFFPEIISRMIVISPFRVTRTLGLFDVAVTVEQDDPKKVHSLAHCIAMSIADCIQMYSPELRNDLQVVYKREKRVEYKKAHKKNARRRYKWRKR